MYISLDPNSPRTNFILGATFFGDGLKAARSMVNQNKKEKEKDNQEGNNANSKKQVRG